MIDVIAKVLPIILLIALGYGLQRTRFLLPTTVVEFKKLIVNLTLPALLFMAFSNVTLNGNTFTIFVVIFLCMSAMFGVGFLIKRFVKSNNRYLPAYFTSFETGMMGYSLYVSVMGQHNLYKIAMVDLPAFVFMFFVLMGFLKQGSGEPFRLSTMLRSVVTSPIVIAVAIGIVLASTGLLATMQQHALSGGVLSFVKMLGGLTVPLICLSIGYDLQIDWANIRKPIAMAFTRLALWLVLAYGISLFIIDRYLHLDSTYQLAVFTMLVLPPSFGLPIFIPETERANKQLLLQAISIHILLAIATFMVIAAVL